MRFAEKMYRPVLIGALILLAIIVAVAILLQMAKALKRKPSVVNNGPLDIHLVGVCPDGGEQLYNVSGRKLKATTSALGAFNTHWTDDIQCRDFLFEIPDVNSQLVFLPSPSICLSGTNRGLSSELRHYFDPTDNPYTLIYSTMFERTYRKKWFFFRFTETIRYIDLTLRYFYGPQGQAICTFTGPFKMNQTIEAVGSTPYYLTFQEGTTLDGSGIMLRLETSEYFDRNTPAIVYDLKGRRYMLEGHGTSSSDKTDLQYQGIIILPEKIAAITFGEKPHEITFKNVTINYPNLPRRTHPKFIDEMAKRLGLTDTSSKYLTRYNFKNPKEAIEVIDIVRGDSYVRQVLDAIHFGKSKIDVTKLDQATQDKIHRTAIEWAETDLLAKYGISLGLMGPWPEFFDMAIERLGRQIPYGNGYLDYERTWRRNNVEIAHAMVNYKMDQPTVEQVQKIKELIPKTDNDSVLKCLFLCLSQMKTQATTDALWELAQNDKPWIWWKATEAWYSRTSRTCRVYDDLSEKMKLRLILVKDGIRDENLEEKALKLLPEMFTPELSMMASHIWQLIWERVSRECDRKVATGIFINYLRRLQSEMGFRQWTTNSAFKGNSKWMAAYIITNLNVWYSTNIGNLGTDKKAAIININNSIRTLIEFQALITEALQWHDNNRDAIPVEVTFSGKVADTAGKPIAGAELSFTRMESYENENGIRRQRIIHIGQCLTDTDGCFELSDFTNGSFNLFSVTAEGFSPKTDLQIQHLIDGRYRYHEQSLQKDNVIVLQRSGKPSSNVPPQMP
jgi:hypothetical protein